jgi:hypothetical protein
VKRGRRSFHPDTEIEEANQRDIAKRDAAMATAQSA